MITAWPRAWGLSSGSALIRCRPEDFCVNERLGFELSGDGEHSFLYLQKRQLNSMQLLAVSRIATRLPGSGLVLVWRGALSLTGGLLSPRVM